MDMNKTTKKVQEAMQQVQVKALDYNRPSGALTKLSYIKHMMTS